VRTILLDEVMFPEHVPQNDGVFRPVNVITGDDLQPNFRGRASRAHPGAARGR
jgi:hypothetical protein